MKIRTSISDRDNSLESHRLPDSRVRWHTIISGFWSESRYHVAHIAYRIARIKPRYWIVESVERDTELDGVTQEDVDEGRLNDDQIQALWNSTLEDVQNRSYRRIVAVTADAPLRISLTDIAGVMYEQICMAGGKPISEPDDQKSLIIS